MATDLPLWDDMSDLDKGAALLHLHQRKVRGVYAAITDYPCTYFDDLTLCALTPAEACRHAVSFRDHDESLLVADYQQRARLIDSAVIADCDRLAKGGAR